MPRGRRLLLIRISFVISALATIGVIWLTVNLWHGGEPGGARAGVLALPFTAAATILAAVTVWTGQKSLPPPNTDAAVRHLLRRVREHRSEFLANALGTTTGVGPAAAVISDPRMEDFPDRAGRLLSREQSLTGVARATVTGLNSLYLALPTGRLVLLGEAGTGKSVALNQVALDLAAYYEDKHEAKPRIPIVLNVTDFTDYTCASVGDVQVAPDRLRSWIVGNLVDDYQLSPRVAECLVQEELILPVLDGLDELNTAPGAGSDSANRNGSHWIGATSDRACAFIRALNTGWRSPVVLSCRTDFYKSLCSSSTLLTDAEHVVLNTLTPEAVDQYVLKRLGSADAVDWNMKWPSCAEEVFTVPLYLSLALQIYETDPNHSPGTVDTPAELKSHIVRTVVDVAVETDATARRRGWRPDDVKRWLATIARVQHQDPALTSRPVDGSDVHIPDLWSACGERVGRRVARATPALLSGAPAVALGAFLCMTGPIGLLVGLLSIIGGFRLARSAYSTESPVKRIDLGLIRSASGRRAVLVALRKGLLRGAALGVVGVATSRALRDRTKVPGLRLFTFGGLAAAIGALIGAVTAVAEGRPAEVLHDAALSSLLGAGAGMLVGILNGTVVAVATALSYEVATVPSSRALVRQGVAYALTVAFIGLAAWTASAIAVGGILFSWLIRDMLDGTALVLGGTSGGLMLAALCTVVVGIGGGWINALGQGHGSVWLRYLLGVTFSARQGTLPYRPAVFIDWCVSAGLMRRSGSHVQFRHREFQMLALEWQPEPAGALGRVPGFRYARRHADRLIKRVSLLRRPSDSAGSDIVVEAPGP